IHTMKLPNRQKTQFSLIYLFIALMVVLSVQSWLRAPQTVDIPMSQFLALVREAKVLKVTLGEREIQGIARLGDTLDLPLAQRDLQHLGLADQGQELAHRDVHGLGRPQPALHREDDHQRNEQIDKGKLGFLAIGEFHRVNSMLSEPPGGVKPGAGRARSGPRSARGRWPLSGARCWSPCRSS